MKQCDVILVPCSDWEATHRVDKHWYRLEKKVIVLTLEELREVYFDAVNSWIEGAEPGHSNFLRKEFDDYISSKGIQP